MKQPRYSLAKTLRAKGYIPCLSCSGRRFVSALGKPFEGKMICPRCEGIGREKSAEGKALKSRKKSFGDKKMGEAPRKEWDHD